MCIKIKAITDTSKLFCSTEYLQYAKVQDKLLEDPAYLQPGLPQTRTVGWYNSNRYLAGLMQVCKNESANTLAGSALHRNHTQGSYTWCSKSFGERSPSYSFIIEVRCQNEWNMVMGEAGKRAIWESQLEYKKTIRWWWRLWTCIATFHHASALWWQVTTCSIKIKISNSRNQ